MTTYEELLGEPVDVLHAAIKIFAVDDNEGLPIRQLAIMLTPGEGRLEIPRGRQGEKGDQGEPAAPYVLLGDRTSAEIAALTLGEFDAGNAYRNTNTNALHYWNGSSWVVHANAFGAQGPQGAAGRLAGIEVTGLAATATPTGSITGPVDAQTLRIGIPIKPGPQGIQGPTATISTASDFDSTTAPIAGDSIVRLANGKWGAGRSRSTRLYSIPENAFADTGDVGSGARTLLASYPLDQLTYASYLEVIGHLHVANGLVSTCEVEVRLGDMASGQLIGKGLVEPGVGDKMTTIVPHYSSPSTPTVNSSPTDYLGVIPASHTGNAGTVYVTLVRKTGLTSVRAFKQDAQLVIKRHPVS